MKKKIMSVLLSTAMVASMLAGCGSTTNEETSDATVAAHKSCSTGEYGCRRRRE